MPPPAREAMVYRFSAIATTVLVGSIAVVATYYRFVWHMAEEGDVPLDEVVATLLLVVGGMVSVWGRLERAQRVGRWVELT